MCLLLYVIVVCDLCLQSGLTPLHFAAFRGHTPTVETLVTAGADVDVADGVRVWYEYNYS